MPSRLVIAVLVALCALVVPTVALAVIPANDDYLKSTTINRADTRLTREEVKTSVDTTEATVQADLFVPGTNPGGGPENTTCKGRTFGKTVWYDLHPDVDGALEIQTAASTSPSTSTSSTTAPPRSSTTWAARPSPARRTSSSRASRAAGTTRSRSAASTPALGPVGGVLGLSFQFFADRDDDNVFDPLDDCPDEPGVRAHGGCPPELVATPKLTATPTGTGIIVKSLSVSATKGSKVEVRCRRRCSGHQARTAGVVSFPLLRGRAVPAGAAIEIFVTKAHSIGRYVRYDVVRGNFKRVDRCLRPGSRKPQKKCT